MKLHKQIETLFHLGTAAGLSDGRLVGQFVATRGTGAEAEAAFAALVDRHGAMVLRVCRQVLGNAHDAEDAAQATFLVLARRAGSISRRESLASWLHGVALRVAAKARQADDRRRARERRASETTMAQSQNEGPVDHELYKPLHDELARLPESFRSALVLCYLEGLTQEQAAAALRCPLGTIQSRLARGRAKLKSRLVRRGFELSAIFPSTGPQLPLPTAAPDSWAEATVRLALSLNQTKASGTAAALAEEVRQAMLFTKLKVAVGALVCAAAMVSAAAAWARHQPEGPAALVAMAADARKEKPPAIPAQRPKKAPDQPEWITRTVHGIVKDEQGKPVAKAWIGNAIRRTPDRWEIIQPADRLRERREPYIDAQGKLVPPGETGKYFELRDEAGKWHPVHPADVRHARKDDGWPTQPPLPSPFGDPLDPRPAAVADNVKAGPVYQVRKSNGFFHMVPLNFGAIAANRTDRDGLFAIEVSISTFFGATDLHFASPDFSRQEIYAFGANDADEAVEIVLRPVRAVRAPVVAASQDEPLESLGCDVYCVEPGHGILLDLPAIGGPGIHWSLTELESTGLSGPSHDGLRLEVSLPVGRYKIRFESETIYRIVDLVVPAGDGPLALPAIRLDSLGWVKMLGKQAAEIEAVDLEGKPVKLADYRGKVVVLAFFAAQSEAANQTVRLLTEVRQRFKDQPLAVLALHDATPTSLANFKKALEPIRAKIAGEIPIRFLLDRPARADRSGLSSARPGEQGSGHTMDIYEGPRLTVIDKNGKLVLGLAGGWPQVAAFTIGKVGSRIRQDGEEDFVEDERFDRTFTKNVLEDTLEDLFGLPRTAKPQPKVDGMPVLPEGPLVVSGKVIDLDGRPVPAARIEYEHVLHQSVQSGPTGEFRFTLDEVINFVSVTVAAKGLASRRFSLEFGPAHKETDGSPMPLAIDPRGRIREPLRMCSGVSVTGKLVRAGKPIADVVMGMKYGKDEEQLEVETQTDQRGVFQFPHVLPEVDCWAYAKVGGLPDQGALIPISFASGADGTSVDLGDLQADKGHKMAGRLVCSDGKALPAGTKVVASFPNGGGLIRVILDAQQRFEFRGIPDGPLWLWVVPPVGSATLGYRLSPKNKCLNPRLPRCIEGQLDRDIADLTILLDPGTEHESRRYNEIDPSTLADFADARADLITGVAPRDYPPQ